MMIIYDQWWLIELIGSELGTYASEFMGDCDKP